MPGLLDMGDDTSNGLVQLGGLLMSGTSPFFGVNAGNAVTQYNALQQQNRKEARADAQAELAQLVQSYKVLKDQDMMAQAQDEFNGVPHTPNPLLSLHEQKLAQLLGGTFKTPQGQPAPVSSQPSIPPQSQQPATLPASVASQYSPVVAPGFQAQGPMPQPQQSQAPQQPNVTLRMATQAANIPDAVARQMIAQGKMPELLKAISEALAPKNGPAGLTRINPATGQMEILGGNATPGTVPFIRNAAGVNVAQPIQGAGEEVAKQEGLKAGAIEAAKAPYQLAEIPVGNTTVKMPLSMALAKFSGGNPAPQIPQSVLDADRTGKPFNATMTPDGRVSFDQPASLGVTQPPRPGSGASFGVGQSPADTAREKALAEAGVKTGTGFIDSANANVEEGLKLKMRNDEARALLKDFRPGMGTDTRTTIGRGVASVANLIPGVSEDTARNIGNTVAGGNTASVQEFQKLAATQAMEALKQAMNSGRITQAEFKIFKDANPTPNMDRQAIERIFDFMDEVSARDFDKQQFANAYRSQGLDMAALPAAWSAYLVHTGKANLAAKYAAPQPNGGGPQSTSATRKYNPVTGKIE